ncbi:hypothetical protein K402DRAFT_392292 [Aulographum hederae CBS 113979]|uniref:Uncharacterized protein n=1 Tax=Aulographum hederae CBS 113979 TaxID=1176131 RepID=A0A6G1H4M6_9PEZI|nr:hypothetical protein K402DRAFT_392292 [Aulographum hederae CBS 113979]
MACMRPCWNLEGSHVAAARLDVSNHPNRQPPGQKRLFGGLWLELLPSSVLRNGFVGPGLDEACSVWCLRASISRKLVQQLHDEELTRKQYLSTLPGPDPEGSCPVRHEECSKCSGDAFTAYRGQRNTRQTRAAAGYAPKSVFPRVGLKPHPWSAVCAVTLRYSTRHARARSSIGKEACRSFLPGQYSVQAQCSRAAEIQHWPAVDGGRSA